ncbi:MAG: penicillin-binding protein 1A [Methylococcales bacterium]|nr:penicillin-binding protein 1A [Methylococcales bacterium]
MPISKEPKRKSLLASLLKWLAALFLAFIATFLIGCYFFVLELDKELPDIRQLQYVQYQTPLDIYSQDGLLIAEFGENHRIPVSIDQIPQQQINAFLAAEDDRFYKHSGVDVKGLLRASTLLAKTGKRKQGGSTITMQVARNFLLSNEKTYLRKLKEIMLALKIEKNYSKQQILELYLNKIYMGQRAYGIAAAAQVYYGKDLAELELQQQAMVAGLPKAPSQYNPIADPERALQRRNYILRRMLELQHISLADYNLALSKPDNARLQNKKIELNAPYVAEMVRQEMMNKYGEDTYNLGLKVRTTVPGHLQIAADHALQQGLHQYDDRHEYRGLPHKTLSKNAASFTGGVVGDSRQAVITAVSDSGFTARLHDGALLSIPSQNIPWAKIFQVDSGRHPFLQINDIVWVRQLDDQSWALTQIPAAEAAFVALNPKNGAILALSGGFDFSHSKYNRATQSKRQPGSGFKPIVYTAALENGYTAASIINDAPLVIEDPSLENGWRPENYTQHYHGPTPLRVALRESINLVSIRLLQEVGISHAIATAMRFGFEKEQLPPTLSLALGSGSASPLKMAEAYSVFANGGYAIKPYLVEQVEDRNGTVIFRADPESVCPDCNEQNPSQTRLAPRVISEQVNFIMNSLLRDVVQRGTATQAKQLGRNDLAGKTGTTNEMRDAWFNGFTPDIVASAWMGFDNSLSLGKGETGGKAALPMWLSFMKTALQELPENPLLPPAGIVQAYINPKDGLLLNPKNGYGVWEYFSAETVPSAHSMPHPDNLPPEGVIEDEEGLF